MSSQSRNKKTLTMFEDAVHKEVEKLIHEGLSNTSAAQRVRSRISGFNNTTMTSSSGVRAADLAEEYAMSSEDACNAIAVSQQVKSLRASGMRRADIFAVLTDRVRNVEKLSHAHPHTKTLIPEVEAKKTKSLFPSSSSTMESSLVVPTVSLGAISSKPTPLPVQSNGRSALHMSPSNTVTSDSNISASTTTTTPQETLKRSRSSDRDINKAIVVKEVESEVDVELARLLTGLSSEINEAMRTGDRSKVALLMRQRDQLRSTRGSNSIITETDTNNGGSKRTKATRSS